MKDLIVVVGPTAVGKTKLALKIASLFHGEIIGADSRQIYHDVNIAVDKPTKEELGLIPHHLIDFVSPREDYSLSQYKELAIQTIKEVQGRGNLPILVGGTGLYIWSIIEGWSIPNVPPDIKFRQDLELRGRKEGTAVLFRELEEIDPEGASKMDPNNLRRIIRALEVHSKTGKPFSEFAKKCPPDFNNLIIGLTVDREELYRRIDVRVDDMINRGMIEETRILLDNGNRLDSPAMTGLGYKHIASYLKGEIDLPDAIQKIKFDTHHLARRQYAWFHLDDLRINWFDIKNSNYENSIMQLVQVFLTWPK